MAIYKVYGGKFEQSIEAGKLSLDTVSKVPVAVFEDQPGMVRSIVAIIPLENGAYVVREDVDK